MTGSLVTFVDAEFAGEVRRFEIGLSGNNPLFGFEDSKHGNLSEFATRAAGGSLGHARVRHVLVHGLMSGNPSKWLRAQQIVDEAMRGRPLAEFIPLAIDIIEAAYAGRKVEEAA
jgi:hypothetical protein